jgi:molybdate transport system substrate-binding protein
MDLIHVPPPAAPENGMGRKPLRTAVAALALLLAGAEAQAGDVTILGSLSAKPPLDELARTYLSRTGTKVTVTYETTPALVAAIRRGARADVLVASDPEAVASLVRDGLATGAPVDLGENGLVLVVRADAPGAPDLAAALGPGPLALAPPDHLAGRLSRTALSNLGLWEGVQGWVVEAPTAQDAAMRVARGSAPRAIAYRTDVAGLPGVRVGADIPREAHPPVVYGAVALAAGDEDDAKAFLDFLARDAGAAFVRHGFLPAAAGAAGGKPPG